MLRLTTQRCCLAFVTVILLGMLASCSTAPKAGEEAALVNASSTARGYFERNVTGLRAQIESSAGYIVFPEVAQWGILVTGGKYGRGTLNRSSGRQIGWASINTGSLGLQAGVQGFKMLVVIEDEATLRQFQDNRLTGAVSAVVVALEEGGSSAASFDNGVAVYQGANTGLMAGVNIGLDYMRHEPLSP